MSERSGELRDQCANYALPSLPTYPSLPEEQNYSPSTPPSSTSTRDTPTLDGSTAVEHPRCPDCGEPHDIRLCEELAATCDCCTSIGVSA